MSKIKSIAITGKGGTGKTMVATMMIKELKKSFKGKLLVIDADSAMSLPYTLNIPVTKKTVSQLRADITGPGMVKDQGIDVWMESVVMHADGLDMVRDGQARSPRMLLLGQRSSEICDRQPLRKIRPCHH